MFLVHNQTNRPVVIADLGAEVPIGKLVDLELIANYERIHQSQDLNNALKLGLLKVAKKTVVRTQKQVINNTTIIEKTTEPTISEEKMAALLKNALSQVSPKNIDKKIQDAVNSGLADITGLIKEAISSASTQQKIVKEEVREKPIVDDKTLADLVQKSINNIEIETNPNAQASKQIRIINKSNTKDLASEL